MNALWSQVIYGQIFGLSIVTAGDFLQLSPVRAKLAFSQFYDKDSMKHLLAWQLWNLFKYTELTKVGSQSYILFIDLINKVKVGNIDYGKE